MKSILEAHGHSGNYFFNSNDAVKQTAVLLNGLGQELKAVRSQSQGQYLLHTMN